MSNPRWSASRFGCYSGCKQKYKLQYIDELIVIGRDSELATKGLAFHSIAENMKDGWSEKELYDLAKTVLGEADFDQEKYPVIKSIPRFYRWWQEYIVKYQQQGFELFKENWENSNIIGKALCGAVDVLMINKQTNEVRIYDYKTGSSAKIDGYENQLLLYAYMVAKRLKIKKEEIDKKIKLFLFFPLAGIKNEDINNPEEVEKGMLKNMKQLIFTNEDVQITISTFEKIVEESEETDWKNLDPIANATMSFACSFCAFCGHQKLCPLSYKSNCRFPRKAIVMTKEEYKKYQEEHND